MYATSQTQIPNIDAFSEFMVYTNGEYERCVTSMKAIAT
jgi:hypothetical protein